jgi:transcriptional regulator with XRE-family HTH domain
MTTSESSAEFGNAIRAERKRRGVTHKELAMAAGTGIVDVTRKEELLSGQEPAFPTRRKHDGRE